MTSLDNQDFRKFFHDTRAPAGAKKPKPKKKKENPAPQKKNEVAEEEAPKYRDRAEERRRGLNNEDDSIRYLTAEETQYLGGSIERTHLVRGLDRLLLTRVKAGDSTLVSSSAGGAGVAAEAGKVREIPARMQQQLQGLAVDPAFPKELHTDLGKAVAEAVLRQKVSNVAELFQPSRMAYVFFGHERKRGAAQAAAADAGDDDEEDEEEEEQEDELDAWLSGRDKQGLHTLPETLMRPRAECPEPPDAMNAAVDAAILREVVGVMRAVKVEGRKKKDRKGVKEDGAAVDKQQHILRLKMYENPQLGAKGAAASAGAGPTPATAPPKASAAAAKPSAAPGPPGTAATGKAVAGAAGSDSGGSGLFDDVGDNYEVDVESVRRKQADKKAAKELEKQRLGGYFGAGADGAEGLPQVAQHGRSEGNEANVPAAAQAPQAHAWPPHADAHHAPHSGYPPQPHGYPPHQHAYAYAQDLYAQQASGYYDAYGNWIPYAAPAAAYNTWNPAYAAASHGAPGYPPHLQHAAAGAGGAYVNPNGPQGGMEGAGVLSVPPDKNAGGKGKGFAAKMGDRAIVKASFTTQQRESKVGKGEVEEDADVYQADVLMGAGGLDEEEEDLRAMESSARALNRADFETDEQFQAYRSKKEAAPKAAFQFGVKVQDGRRTHKDMDKRLTQKLDNELKTLRGMEMDRGGKKLDFSRFGNAFNDASKPDVEATPARKRPRIQGL